MRREEFEDDDVLVTEDEEEDDAVEDDASGSEDGDGSEEEDAPPSSGSPEDDDDGDEDMSDSDDDDDDDDDDEQPADPRFAPPDSDSESESDDDDGGGNGNANGAAARRRGIGKAAAPTRTSLQKMDTEEQRAMLAGELTPEEALLRVEARELARRARKAQRRHERAAAAAIGQLTAALRGAMPADGALPTSARALAGAFMDALVGREAADMVARSATAPPPAAVARLGAAALGAAVPEEPVGAAHNRLSSPSSSSSSSSAPHQPAPVVVVDVALALPAGVLAHKDHVGYRYHARRAVYLAAVAAHLAGAASGGGNQRKRPKKEEANGGGKPPPPPFGAWRQQWVAGGPGGGDPTLPRLVLWPPPPPPPQQQHQQQQQQAGFVLRLTAVPAAAAAFPPHRLHPDRNNVRWVAKPAAASAAAGAVTASAADEASGWLPTPAYNAALLAETHALAHGAFLAAAFGRGGSGQGGGILAPSSSSSSSPLMSARSEAMADALALLQLWARRAGVAAAPGVGGARGGPPPPAAALAAGGYPSPGPARCPDGLTDHFLAMLLAHCCPGGSGVPGAAAGLVGTGDDDHDEAAAAAAAAASSPPPHPLQAARAALRALADAAAWCAPKGVAMARWREPGSASSSIADPSKRPPSAKALAKRHEVVFAGPEGWGNLAAGVSAGALQQASAAARRALTLLERPAAGAASEALAAVFMDAPPTAAAFDYVWRVRVPPLRVASAGGGGGGEGGAGATAAAASATTAAAILGSDAGRAGLLPGAALHAHAAGDACGALAREQERRAEGWARRALGDRAVLLRALAREPPALPRSGPCADASRALGDGSEQESIFLVLPEREDDARPTLSKNKQKQAAPAKNRPASSDDDEDDEEDEDDDDEEDEEDEDDDASAAAPPPVLIACVADPALTSRLVDVGPAADDPKQATRFRALWGERSELRRLADGRICESVSWAADVGADSRHAIADLAVAHVLRRHLPSGCQVVGCASALDPALRAPEGDDGDDDGDEEGGGWASAAAALAAVQKQPPFEDSDAAAMRAAEAALERLARALRSLPQGAGEPGAAPGLPLRIVAALPASAASGRRTLPFPPRPHPLATAAASAASDRPLGDLPSAALGPAAAPFADAALGRGGGAASAFSSPSLQLPRCLPDPLVLVAQLEGSGRWPDEPRAFAKMKLAMAAQLAAALARAHPASCARAAAVELDVGEPAAQGAAAAAGITRAATVPPPGQEDGGGMGGGGGGVELLWEGFAARVVLQTDRDASAKQRALAVAQAFATANAGSNNSSPSTTLLLSADLLRLRAPPEAAVAAAHHGLVAATAAAHPAFAPTCRLAARWVGCHLAAGPGGGLRHEAVELLVAAVFGRAVASGGGGGAASGTAAATAALCAPPATRVAGFLRFLRLLEQFPWSHRPLIVDPQGELDSAGAAAGAEGGGGNASGGARQQQQRRRAAEVAFAARREAAAALRESQGSAEASSDLCSTAMFIATPRDMEISYWTLDGPSDASLARLRAAAGRCAAALAAMVERGPGIGAAGGAAEAEEEAQRDARDDDSAWMRALFSPELGFGALLLLRPGALPSASRALPCARRALARALASPSARRLPRLDPARDRPERAVLRGFPRSLLRAQPAARLSQELLVGFEPLALLAARLTAALGTFASFSVDLRGGTPCVGVRWRREAFAARPLRAGGALAHCCVPMPKGREAERSKKAAKKRRRAGEGDGEEDEEDDELVVVPDVAQVLHEAQEIGAGIVDRVLLLT